MATRYVQVFERVPVQPRDAREASDVFYKQGTGDVLLNYENEIYITNKMYGEKESLPYIVPDRNVRVSPRSVQGRMASVFCAITMQLQIGQISMTKDGKWALQHSKRQVRLGQLTASLQHLQPSVMGRSPTSL